ncbi:hypothetical protein C8Q73DRAFT_48378 [Cubamyces lactineus]|nr:hypothetical protein C8Q73DRAFT_48378 [Cubamyces lactineus]
MTLERVRFVGTAADVDRSQSKSKRPRYNSLSSAQGRVRNARIMRYGLWLMVPARHCDNEPVTFSTAHWILNIPESAVRMHDCTNAHIPTSAPIVSALPLPAIDHHRPPRIVIPHCTPQIAHRASHATPRPTDRPTGRAQSSSPHSHPQFIPCPAPHQTAPGASSSGTGTASGTREASGAGCGAQCARGVIPPSSLSSHRALTWRTSESSS